MKLITKEELLGLAVNKKVQLAAGTIAAVGLTYLWTKKATKESMFEAMHEAHQVGFDRGYYDGEHDGFLDGHKEGYENALDFVKILTGWEPNKETTEEI